MANYKKLIDVEVMEEVSENTMALVEENGKLKKVPCGAGFGGGGVATAIIKGNKYMNALSEVSPMASAPEEFICSNMTFEEARDIILSGEPLMVVIMMQNRSGGYSIYPVPCVDNQLDNEYPCIHLCGTIVLNMLYTDHNTVADYDYFSLYWTSEGLSEINPNVPI